MLKNLLIAAVFASVCGAVHAYPLEYEYQLKNYPSAAPACHQLAQQLGERLAVGYGVTIVSARCLPNQDNVGVDLSITYNSEQDLPPTSTYNDHAFGEQGWYTSQSACLAGLDAEEAHFTTATGLTTFHSICQKDVSSYSSLWLARVDAFGWSDIRPQFTWAILFGTPVGYNQATFAANVKSALAERGYDVIYARLDGGPSIAHLRIGYYGTESMYFSVKKFGLLDQVSQCQTELTRLTAITGIETSPALATFCMSMTTGGLELQSLFESNGPYQLEFSVEQFVSYSACTAARDNLIDFYRDSGRNVLGGLCTRLFGGMLTSQKWAVQLIEPNTPL